MINNLEKSYKEQTESLLSKIDNIVIKSVLYSAIPIAASFFWFLVGIKTDSKETMLVARQVLQENDTLRLALIDEKNERIKENNALQERIRILEVKSENFMTRVEFLETLKRMELKIDSAPFPKELIEMLKKQMKIEREMREKK